MKLSAQFFALLFVLSWPLTARATPLSPVEQADGFFERGAAAEMRGDTLTAKTCYQLAIRAFPKHERSKARLVSMTQKHVEDEVKKGSEAEAMGDLKSANHHFAMAVNLDPTSLPANTRLKDLERKMGAEFRNFSQLEMARKMDSIVIPRIDFEDTSLLEAVIFLRQRSADLDRATLDPVKKGIMLTIRKAPTGEDLAALRIDTLRLRNIPLALALQYICDKTKTRYLVDESGVTIVSASDASASPRTSPAQGAPAIANIPVPTSRPSTLPTKPPGPAVWKSKDGRTTMGEFVGLDGEAVVIKRDGKEFTIPFGRLDAASVAQARDFSATKADVLLHYDFSDGAGTIVKDRSGNGRDGTLAGFANTGPGGGQSGAASGWTSEGALMFDGVDDKVVTPLMVADLAGGGLTIEAVVSHKNVESFYSVVVSTDATVLDSGAVVQLTKVNKGNRTCPGSGFGWRFNGLKPFIGQSNGPTSVGDGRLHHMAVVYDAAAGTARLYFDHLLRAERRGIIGKFTGNNRIWLGASGWNAKEGWFGPMSEVRITRKALAVEQFLSNPNPPDMNLAKPTHRYTFTADANDSLGGAHGKVVDPGSTTARFIGGEFDLTGNIGQHSTAMTEDAYIDLPNGILGSLKGRYTLELWCTMSRWMYWNTACTFGRTAAGEDISSKIIIPPYACTQLVLRGENSDLESWVTVLDPTAPNQGKSKCSAGFEISKDGMERHYALVVNVEDTSQGENGSQHLYLDGFPIASAPLPPGVETIEDNNNWLGRAQPNNRTFVGRYNEFRIYDKALTPREVLASHVIGPDAKFNP